MKRREAIAIAFKGLAFVGALIVGVRPQEAIKPESGGLFFRINADTSEAVAALEKLRGEARKSADAFDGLTAGFEEFRAKAASLGVVVKG